MEDQYRVQHLSDDKSYTRSSIFSNPHQDKSRKWTHCTPSAVEPFHSTLPHYAETALHSLPSVASELGFSHVFLKDESTRFGLPAFKILGASWAIHNAVCKRLGLPAQTTSWTETRDALKGRNDVRLVLCTEGNWGRACARMAKYLDIPCKIYVPSFMNEYTRNLLRNEEEAEVVVLDGSYDDTIAAVQRDAEESGALMTMDTSWEGYEEFPNWVTQGYTTMLTEADRQIVSQTHGGSKTANLAFASVGVGSWAHSVVSHYKSITSNPSRPNKVITVEPSASGACFQESLHNGHLTSIHTSETIMNGMNCGTPSEIAWPIMRDGVDAAVTVSDLEAHRCVEELKGMGISAGPCGAACLAALRKLCKGAEWDGREQVVGEREDRMGKVVVLFSTEGWREYAVPT